MKPLSQRLQITEIWINIYYIWNFLYFLEHQIFSAVRLFCELLKNIICLGLLTVLTGDGSLVDGGDVADVGSRVGSDDGCAVGSPVGSAVGSLVGGIVVL